METSKPGVVAGGGHPTRVASLAPLAPRWFSHQSLAVQELRRRADPTFGDDPDQWGEWIADVERHPSSCAAATSCASRRRAG